MKIGIFFITGEVEISAVRILSLCCAFKCNESRSNKKELKLLIQNARPQTLCTALEKKITIRILLFTHMANNMNLQSSPVNNPKVNPVTNRVTTALLIIYLVVLYWILLLKLGVRFTYLKTRSVNLVPFSQPLILNGKADVGEIMLNVLIFVPLGIYAGILFYRWNFGKNLFIFFLMSLMVEALQFTLAVGAFDITDIIANTLGGIIGFMIFKAIEKSFNNRLKAQRFINIIATAATVVIISLLLLLKLNMLPVRYQ